MSESRRGEISGARPAAAGRPRRWLRRVGLWVFVVSTVAMLLVWYGLESEHGRRHVLDLLGHRMLEGTGWQVTIDDFDLRLGGQLELVGLRAGAPEGPPVAQVDRMEVAFDWRELLTSPTSLGALRLTGVVVDASAPRPPTEPAQEPEPEEPGTFPLNLESWRLDDLEIRGSAPDGGEEDGAAGWLAAWSLVEVAAGGSLVDGALVLRLEGGRALLERRADGEVLTLELGGQMRGPVSGPWSIDHLEARGDALDATLAATLGLRAEHPFKASFQLDLDPAWLLPELAGRTNRVEANGQVDLRRSEARLEARAESFPIAALEPFLAPETLVAAVGRADFLDLDADLRITPLESEGWRRRGAEGRADIILRRGAEVLARLDVTAPPREEDAPGLIFDVAAEVLPDAADRLTASGQLRAEALQRLHRADLRDGVLDVDSSDLRHTLEELARYWPKLATLAEGAPAGALRVRAGAEGQLHDPRLTLSGNWLPASGGSARLEASGRFLSPRGQGVVDLELDGVDPGPLGLPLAGAATGTWRLSRQDGAAELTGTLDVASPEVALAGVHPGADGATLTAQLSVESGDGGWPGGLLAGHAVGEVSLHLTRPHGTGPAPPEAPPGAPPEVALAATSLKLDARVDGPLGPGLLHDGLALDAHGVDFGIEGVAGGPILLPTLSIEAAAEEGILHVRRLEGLWRPPESSPASVVGELPFSAEGQAVAEGAALRSARLHLAAGEPAGEMHLELDARLDEAGLTVDVPRLRATGAIEEARARLSLPLRPSALGGGGPPALEGPVEVELEAGGIDLRGFAGWTTVELPAVTGDLGLTLRLDAADPSAATGELIARGLRAEAGGDVMESDGPIRIRVGGRRASLEAGRVELAGRSLEASGEARLRDDWRFGEAPEDLVERFRGRLAGGVEGSLMNRFLAGGRAEGIWQVDLRAEGDPASMTVDLDIDDGEAASLTWDEPYVTRFEQPSANLRFEDGTLHISRAELGMNEGQLRLRGEVGERIDVAGELVAVRYRLDHGLAVETSGTFAYSNRPEPGKLTARLELTRGALRRQIDAGAELLDALLAPPALETGGAASPFADTELDVTLSTVEGIRVKNNLADLRLGWAPIRVEGSLGEPRLLGTIEAEPEGRVYAYGQVIRLDRAALIFSGAPGAPGDLDLQVTTSLEDPALATPEDERVLADFSPPGDGAASGSEEADTTQARDSLASGLTTYFGDQLASRLGRALGRTQLRYRPLWIFGEADPEARLVVSRDLSRFVSAGVAFNLREADERTYLLELGNLPRLPRLSGTVFSDDASRLGATVQQRLVFGRGGRDDDALPRLQDVEVTCGSCVIEGRGSAPAVVRGLLRDRDGQPIDPESLFDLEIDLEEAMKDAGFSQANADLSLDVADGLASLDVALEPGPQTEFVWAGEEPPRRRRRTLRSLYRSDYGERASLEELRRTAERVWRSEGYPWPEVVVEAEVLDEPRPVGARRVTVTSVPGEKLDLTAPDFRGVPPQVAAELVGRFASRQSRAELVAGKGGAGERLLEILGILGYPAARLLDRAFDPDTQTPILYLDAGRRRHIERVELTGVPGGEQAHCRSLVSLEAGAPLVTSELAAASFEVEKYLRQEGWIDARVRLVVSPSGSAEISGRPPGVDAGADSATVGSAPPAVDTSDAVVELQVEPGIRQRLEDVRIAGTEVTRDAWVERLSNLQRGELIDAGEVAGVRRRLLETRLFDRVQANVETDEAGQATLHLALRERPRYLMSYGLRWEESEGLGAMLDVLDRNSTGRGIGLGLRAIWVRDDRSLRLYGQFPRVFNSPVDLELFVEGFEEDEEGLLAEGFELSAQLGWKLSEHTQLRSYMRYRRADVVDERLRIAGEPAESRESVPLLGLGWLHDRRDDPLDPRQGFFASVDLSGSEDVITGDNAYGRLFAQADLFLPFGSRWVWAQGARLGLAEVWSGELDRDVRFFAGGARSVRGYGSRSLGPREILPDGTDRALGGEALLVIHEELRVDLTGSLQGVVFLDLGNVYDTADRLGEDLLAGVGVGVRYRSPIGLLRLDLAHPLDGRLEDDELEVYFGLGQAF